ncbi:MAG: hypothetical protein KDD38_05565 [Bdellovibrionales bacterium]|nr:hypothetical protein [Bdellovibrionales bacterium]
MNNGFGGSLLKGKRKSKRVLICSQPTHLVLRLKSNLPPLFDPHDIQLRRNVFGIANKYQIRIYNLIFNHSHLHGAFLFQDHSRYVKFIREATALMTTYFTKESRIPDLEFNSIFCGRPYTRSAPWGKAYQRLQNYMIKNENESGLEQHSINEKLKIEFYRMAKDSRQLSLL